MALFMVASCQKESASEYPFLGEWHYEATESRVAEDVWISFLPDGTFEMYQMIGEGPYWYSTGEFTYDFAESVLSGIYSDRCPWKRSYQIVAGQKTLKMIFMDQPEKSMIYRRSPIPSFVREKSLPLTKAESVERHL